MERWERDAIDRRIDRVEKEGRRVEEAGRKTEERLRAFELRDLERIHLNVMVLFWIFLGAVVASEIAMAIVKG